MFTSSLLSCFITEISQAVIGLITGIILMETATSSMLEETKKEKQFRC